MISAISNQGKMHFMFSQGSINQQKLIEFFECLLKDIYCKVYIILDVLKVHYGKLVTDWVEQHNNQIRLFFLPSYFPEYNPDKILNNDLKQTTGSHRQDRTEAVFQMNADAFLISLADASGYVRSCFDHPALDSYRHSVSDDGAYGNV